MKKLRITEKVLFTLATIFGAFTLTIGQIIDRPYIEHGYLTAGLAAGNLFGLGLVGFAVLLVVGALLRFNENKVTAHVGDAFTIVAFSTLFVVGLTVPGGNSMTFAIVSGSIYAVSAIFRLIIAIVARVKPEVKHDDFDPDNDEKIKNIIKWKNLLNKGIITEKNSLLNALQSYSLVKKKINNNLVVLVKTQWHCHCFFNLVVLNLLF